MRGEPDAATVAIVTHDDALDLPVCLAALGAQSHRPLELVVVDCASRDGSASTARRHAPAGWAFRLLEPGENLGFAGGMNAAFRASSAAWFLTLNADATLAPDYVERLIERARRAEGVRPGALTGRLNRPGEEPILDACGFYLVPSWRHLDRGSGERDRGQYAAPEIVFGGTGAATLWRRAAVEDVALEPGEMFDPHFHTFREDAELAFRLAARGWTTVYEPAARALHRRTVLPGRRRQLSALANRNSLRNRYLLRIYHQTLGNLLWTLPFTLARDLAALAWVLLVEHDSLPAYGWLWRNRRELLARRRRLVARRTAAAGEIERWFLRRARPLPVNAR